MPTPTRLLLLLLGFSVVALCCVPPIPQNPAYHNYADQRTLLGIPFFWNVVSNAPMFFLGLQGLWMCSKDWSRRPAGVARWIPLVLSLGIFATCFGSAYYHWMPSNSTLLWDRLPMTFMFMALFSLLMYDFLGGEAGRLCFWLAIPLGVGSVLYWHFTEVAGRGDLRWYALVQFFPMLAAGVLLAFFPKKVDYVGLIWRILGWYALAKICENFDHEIFRATAGLVSGHTAKHFVGAVSLVYAIRLIRGWFPGGSRSASS